MEPTSSGLATTQSKIRGHEQLSDDHFREGRLFFNFRKVGKISSKNKSKFLNSTYLDF